MENTMQNRLCLVTGSTSGLGEATARGLAALGATVILACRDMKRGQALMGEIRSTTGNNRVFLLEMNLASKDSILKAVKEYKDRFPSLHVLVNCAGLQTSQRELTDDGFEMMIGVNHLGPFLLTTLLQDLLIQSAPSRIVNYSSSWQKPLDFDDLMSENTFDSMKIYAQTKKANVMFTNELARRLKGTGVTVNSLHPGVVRTRLARDIKGPFKWMLAIMAPFLLTPAKGAETALYLATSDEVKDSTGKYYVKKKAVPQPGASNKDEADEARLWDASMDLIG